MEIQSEFATFYQHTCSACGIIAQKIIKHHVSYYPEYVIPICDKCHFLLRRKDVLAYFIRYTREEYSKFYKGKHELKRKHVKIGIKDEVFGLNQRYPENFPVKEFFEKIDRLYQSKPHSLILQSSENYGDHNSYPIFTAKNFFHTVDLLSKIYDLPYDISEGEGGYSLWKFNKRYSIRLGEDEFYEQDESHKARYGSPRVEFYCDYPGKYAYLWVTQPGRYGGAHTIDHGYVDILAEEFRKRIPKEEVWSIGPLFVDIEEPE